MTVVDIEARARRAGVDLGEAAVQAIARHAEAVLQAPERLHLTSIREPAEFLERHVGESLEGAALLPPDVRGLLLDLGSGNGYPALPVAAARPGLRPVLTEASYRKAAFLRAALEHAGWSDGEVHAAQVQRPSDLPEELGPISVLTTRAMGGWERVVPRMASALAPDGHVLLWAGEGTEAVLARAAWKRLRLERRAPLPGRASSWVWLLRRAG